MPEELLIQLQFLTNKVNKYHKQIEDLRSKLVQNENQYASILHHQLLSANHTQHNHRHHRSHHSNNRHRDYISHRTIKNNDTQNNRNHRNLYTSSSRKPYIVNDDKRKRKIMENEELSQTHHSNTRHTHRTQHSEHTH